MTFNSCKTFSFRDEMKKKKMLILVMAEVDLKAIYSASVKITGS